MPKFSDARDFLIQHRTDYERAVSKFRWPEPSSFNWALDWFDGELASNAETRDQIALWLAEEDAASDTKMTFRDLSKRSNQVANYFRALGLKRGDRALMILGNVVPLWEIMLAAMKLGIVLIPAATLLTPTELADRIERGRAKLIITSADQVSKFKTLAQHNLLFVVCGTSDEPRWRQYSESLESSESFEPEGTTAADDPMLLYFTSGTTAQPKLVLHTQRSYPVGALSTMYWLGLRPGHIHLNISSPGWAKHAWSSFFAPWNAGATILVYNQPRFDAQKLLDFIVRCKVTNICAPPTVWRMLIHENLADWKVSLQEVCSAGEPLNPEVISRVEKAWGMTIRDGYGQTETTALVGNTPGQPVKPGSMGRPLPGYGILIVNEYGKAAREGQINVDLSSERPAGLMYGYQGSDGSVEGVDGQSFSTGDVAFVDEDDYLTFVGRADDVFKSSDYRISPFELESVLIEHDAVAEAGVVPVADDIRLAVPKAYVSVCAGVEPSADTARSIFEHCNSRLAPFKRIRRIEFVKDLPKTISGKIRRVELRTQASREERPDAQDGQEYWEEEFRTLSREAPGDMAS